MKTNNLSVPNHPRVSSSEPRVISNGKDYLSSLPPELILMIGMLAWSLSFVEACPSFCLRLHLLDRYRLHVLASLCLVSKSFNHIFQLELYSECNFFDTGLDIFSLIPQDSIA